MTAIRAGETPSAVRPSCWAGEVLLVGGAACVPDEKRRHGAPPV
jgi:hypothetical protein